MAHPGKSPVRIRARISPAEAVLMRLEAKRAKGPNGTLVPEDSPGARLADPLPPRVAPKAEMAAAKAATGQSESAPVKSQAESKVEAAKSDDVAARLEAALRGHLETVASAFASTRAAKAEARGEQKAETPAAARSIYAPDGVRMPAATLLDIDPLPPLPTAVRPDRDFAAHDSSASEDELRDERGAIEEHAAGEVDPQAEADSYDEDDIAGEGDEPADEDDFCDAPRLAEVEQLIEENRTLKEAVQDLGYEKALLVLQKEQAEIKVARLEAKVKALEGRQG